MREKRKDDNFNINRMYRDIVVGFEDEIERRLKVQGHSQIFIDEIIDKVDEAVKYAGLLGRNIESISLNKKLAELKKVNHDLVVERNQLKKRIKELEYKLGGYENAVL